MSPHTTWVVASTEPRFSETKAHSPIFAQSTNTSFVLLSLIPFCISTLAKMPRPGLPLTPGSSSDIKGKDGTQQLATFQLSFELPPPAIHDASRISPSGSRISPTDPKPHPLATTSPALTFPMQPAETVKARRRSSAAKEAKDNTFALPPPPTRSRKIIQMKPRTQDGNTDGAGKDMSKSGGKASAATKAGPASATTKTTTAAKTDDAAGDKGKKKQPSATSAAGRKIARKTAHSLIERRRRSKMNEEFAVLKSMIPACTGEMHKLSILQVCCYLAGPNFKPCD